MHMRRTIKIVALAAVTVVAGTAGAFADEYSYYGRRGHARYGDSYAFAPGPGYNAGPGYYAPGGPQPMYYRGYVPGYYGNGANHPTPSSTQGDVGPEGNNNGTRTGVYRRW
jgi:hypothetical protein